MAKAKSTVSTAGSTGTVTRVSRKNALRFLANKTSAANAGTGATTEDIVAQRAYYIYLEEGCPEGKHLDHWLRAESELR